jgi:hypothetical protein
MERKAPPPLIRSVSSRENKVSCFSRDLQLPSSTQASRRRLPFQQVRQGLAGIGQGKGRKERKKRTTFQHPFADVLFVQEKVLDIVLKKYPTHLPHGLHTFLTRKGSFLLPCTIPSTCMNGICLFLPFPTGLGSSALIIFVYCTLVCMLRSRVDDMVLIVIPFRTVSRPLWIYELF